MSTEQMATPSSRWAAHGLPDPHGDRYDCERAALALGHLTDDELANAVYLHGNEQPSMADLVAGKALSGIVYLKAAKERIRWLSRALAATGKQQVGAFPWENFPSYLIDKCEGDTISEEGIQRAVADMAKDARYCPTQQVGEVQGDALWWLQDAINTMAEGGNETHTEKLQALHDALAARQPGAQVPVCSGGFVIGNGSGENYMAWGQVGPEWVADRSAALWLVRRADAEALAAENEDAWLILPVERCALPPNGWDCTLASGHEGPCPTIAAPPAQGIDLGQVREIRIPARNKLDPISVFVQDQAAGRGRIVVTCYGNAWQAFWGAMGDRTVMQFVAQCDPDYVAGSMLQGRQTRIAKHERDYATRIAAEVIAEFRTLIDKRNAVPGVLP